MKRWIMCSGDKKKFRKCKNRAVYFPITDNNNFSRQHYCSFHWKKYETRYNRVLRQKNGVIAGRLKEIAARLEGNESLNISAIVSDSRMPYHTASLKESSIFKRIRLWLKKHIH